MAENALETLTVDFELRGYREAIQGIRDYTKELAIAEKKTGQFKGIVGQAMLAVAKQFQTRPGGASIASSVGSPVSPSSRPTVRPPALQNVRNKVLDSIRNVEVSNFAPGNRGLNAQPAKSYSGSSGPKDRQPLEVIKILPVFVRAFHSTALGQLATLLKRSKPSTVPSSQGTSGSSPSGERFNLAGLFAKIAVTAAAATGSVTALARAGLHGTVQGNQLALQFEILSRNIAGIMLPVVRLFTTQLQAANRWLENLTKPQQNKILGGVGAVAGIGLAAGAFATLLKFVGPLAGLLAPVASSLLGITVAAGPVAIVLGVFAAAVVAAGAAFVYIAATSKPVQESLKKVWSAMVRLWEATQPLREVLYDIAERFVNLGLNVFAIYLSNLAKTVADVVGVVPSLIVAFEGVYKLISTMVSELIGIARNPFNARGLGQRIKGVMQGVLEDIQNANQKAVIKQLAPKANGQPGERVTLAGSGRESFEAAFDRIQNAVNLRADPVQIAQEQLVVQKGLLAVANQQLAIGQKQAGNGVQPAINARPAPNGRAGN
jgi:hypothetical protein